MAEPQRQTFRDANGRTHGRSTTDARGNTTYYYETWARVALDDVCIS